MTRDDLLAALQSIEWNDIEFKEATWAVPKDALSTVSAFANTDGGHLVFGVKQTNGTFTVTGMTDADQMQNTFLGQVRDTNKVSVLLPVEPKKHDLPEGIVLAFYIPEASRQHKPVYIDGNPKKAYIRRGGRDDTCTGDELQRFWRDASSVRYDAEPLDVDSSRCFDEASVRWYRTRFAASNPGRDTAADDTAFLRTWGFLVEQGGVLRPTRAAILVLGSGEYVRQVLPRMVTDVQLYRNASTEYDSTVRWADRLTIEDNLIKAWQVIVEFYFRHSERPFAVDAGTLRRDDDPPDYISFREAAINLLIHQDFGDTTRVPVIRFFRDQTEFFNPGDAFASREQLLDPGDKEVRNPSIVNAFRRVGLSDQGGTGVRAIFDGWRKLGYLPPEIENLRAEKSFRLRLRKEKLITEAQLLAQASLGVHLSEHEAVVFAFLLRDGQVDLADIKALTGLAGAQALDLAQRLTVQVLIEPLGEAAHTWRLVPHLRARFVAGAAENTVANQSLGTEMVGTGATDQVTEQVAPDQAELDRSLDRLTEVQWRIVGYADVPRSLAELMAHAGYRQRPHFVTTHLEPLLTGGVLRPTIPDKPRSSRQRYVLTEAGIQLKLLHEKAVAKPDEENGY
ncbi:AAA family ATPase [Rhizobium leguminosarum bv. viciae]|uniref:RNA-binding domain-containing protein n=1 Tax=Rhizobium leguminosarum TaxID=384 RepID=UPI000E0E3506|nr:RNA-binding domain-containing protein [Rhizobium leguminosarum]NEJ80350.1 AAA family ATPase [Rhizobium leguminosarum]TBY19153.1 AAA family ATPase [Rhizobium leguminosarum bv. viciae]TBY26684.1 AAA family ATPase [Rhizobium leguminosarum bv. viciae]TBY54137.1 AAA family ATPase [Rhizobium leguminosarum bv. viciae]TBY99389.1 AAA family ATPase [Rhizobium leguminosarum bv. viciae]